MPETSEYKPAGFPDLVPYFVVDGASDFIVFLTNAFGAKEIERHLNDEGRIMHAEVRLGDSIVEIGDTSEAHGASRFNLHFYVRDVDAVHKNAVECGAASKSEPVDMPYGERGSGIADKWGNIWWLATSL